MNGTYKLDEKGIPYRVGAGVNTWTDSGLRVWEEREGMMQRRKRCKGKPEGAFTLQTKEAALAEAGAGTDCRHTAGLLRHSGQLQGFRLYFFSQI